MMSATFKRMGEEPIQARFRGIESRMVEKTVVITTKTHADMVTNYHLMTTLGWDMVGIPEGISEG